MLVKKNVSGSSPRMRGAQAGSLRLLFEPRIIPADAGSTRLDCHRYHAGGDHPRGCGEHYLLEWRFEHVEGSSPRMRGARTELYTANEAHRIIPADAGSTVMPSPSGRSCWDHPRGCGEHRSNRAELRGQVGSSPRMRGARQD